MAATASLSGPMCRSAKSGLVWFDIGELLTSAEELEVPSLCRPPEPGA
jgi:hypothetical protein